MQMQRQIHSESARETNNAFHPAKAHSKRGMGPKRVFGRDLTNKQRGSSRMATTDKEVQRLKAADSIDDDEKYDLTAEQDLTPWDALDVGDVDLTAAEYAKGIIAALRQQEAGRTVGDFMASQQNMTERMRAVLVEWLVEVNSKFELSESTFFLGVNLVDRFLATKAVKKTELQLLGSSCLWIASKYHDIYAPEVDDFVFISDEAFSTEQVVAMEEEVLKTLSFDLTVPTVLNYAERYSKISAHYLRKERERKIIADLIMYCAEHSVVSYALCRRAPSLVGAACFVYSSLSTKVFTVGRFHEDGLERAIGYSIDALLPTMRELDAAVKNAKRSERKALLKKYSNAKHCNIGKLNFHRLDVSFLTPSKHSGARET